MRRHGTVNSAAGLVSGGHLCWSYQGRAGFRAGALEYLRDGIAAGQWIEYVGSGSGAQLQAELTQHSDLAAAFASGGISVSSVEEFYEFEPETRAGPEKVVDPQTAVLARMEATEQALEAGYTGFRAVVDATALARTRRQREAFAQFEHLIDQQMSRFPVTALCGYDLDELGETAVAELACLHPLSNQSAPFRLYAEPGVDAALNGTVDQTCAGLFSTTMSRVAKLSASRQLELDGQGIDHLDQEQVRELNRLAGNHDRTVEVTEAPDRTAQLIEQLGVPHVGTKSQLGHGPDDS